MTYSVLTRMLNPRPLTLSVKFFDKEPLAIVSVRIFTGLLPLSLDQQCQISDELVTRVHSWILFCPSYFYMVTMDYARC